MKIRKLVISMVALATSCSCLLLSGCKSNEEISAEASASISPTAMPSTEATTSAPSPDSTTIYEAGASWTPAPSATPSTTSTPAATDTYKAGTLTTKEYNSTYIGLQFKSDSDYTLATKEQLQKALGQGAKIAYGDKSDEVQELTKDMVTYEMMASSKSGYPNVSIGVEKATIDSMTEKQYFDAFKTQLASLDNVTATVGDAVTENLCGQDYLVAPITMKVNSIEVIEKIYIRKKESNFIFLTLTGLKGKESDMDALMKHFTASEL